VKETLARGSNTVHLKVMTKIVQELIISWKLQMNLYGLLQGWIA